ncbi:3'(2'),5'-bisphosphate nucleotidase CysQ [Neomegalonema perideroedes]|uniref:3'(2'),5'-bisphosphate nucleotidase CysQ n=1 Tax=Neomegalonema perideroedes TaxID=217219 RepID=UPI00037E4AB3|nr:3'(2'),5'-bisphosphate nucleotidase CysQ [Neomegalonema perideroedes]
MSPFDPQGQEDLDADFALLTEAVEAASEAAMRHFGRQPQVWDKGGSPVSEGDFAADAALRERLRGARPDYGWMSEESDDPQSRLKARRVWIVDPIDGTRNYISAHKDFGVCAALVEDGRVVLGAVGAPARGEFYAARLGGGAFLNGARVRRAAGPDFAPDLSSVRFVGNNAMTDWRLWRDGKKLNAKPVYVGSLALRVCMVGTGRFDAAMIVNPFHEWDLAAAEIFAAEAGVRVVGFDGKEGVYNQPSPVRPNLVAAPEPLAGEILSRMA